MTRVFAVILVALAALAFTGCFDPEPGEISVIAKYNGRQRGCGVQVWNSKGAQIQLVPTDMDGLLYIKLEPGKYTLKFQDNEGNPFPAVVDVDLESGESEVVRVELSEGPPAEE